MAIDGHFQCVHKPVDKSTSLWYTSLVEKSTKEI